MLQTSIDVPDAIVLATAETYESFHSISQEVSEWVERMHGSFIHALVEQGGEVDVWVHVRGETERKVSYPRDWEKSIAELAAGQITSISIGAAVPADALRGLKTFRLWTTPVQGAPEITRITFFARPSALIDELLPPPSVWAQAIQEGAVAIRAVDGFLTVGRAAIVGTAYEDQLMRSPLVGVQEAGTLVRGFFWGSILSARHIAALGGIRRVKQDAPVVRVVDLSRPNHELVYLELTSDLFAVAEDDEEQLREFLAPVLPTANSVRHP